MAVKPGDKGTELGVIPEDWMRCRLRDLVDRANPIAYGVLKPGAYIHNGVPLLQIRDVIHGEIDIDQLHRISEQLDRQYSRTKLVGGEIVVSLVGTIGRVALLPVTLAGGNLHRNLARIHVSKGCDSKFVSYFLNSDRAQAAIKLTTFGSTQALLNLADLRNLAVDFPPLAEQRAIAEALSDVDGLLGGLDRLVAKKRDLKQAAMQQLLTGQSRLPGFHGAWGVKRLGELGSTYGGLTGKTKADFGDGSARYITFMNIMSNVVIDCGTFEQVKVTPAESQNRAMKGDLFFNGSSETPKEVAMCAVLLENVHDVYLNSFCFGFRFRDGAEADGLFLAYYLRSREGRELIKSLAQGSTRYNLSKVALLKSPLRLPSLREQTAIAEVLMEMDAELAALEHRQEKTRALKQAMMQELLTGRTRLISLEEAHA